jgi:hypothetical protein
MICVSTLCIICINDCLLYRYYEDALSNAAIALCIRACSVFAGSIDGAEEVSPLESVGVLDFATGSLLDCPSPTLGSCLA